MGNRNELKRLKEILSIFAKHGIKDGIKSITNPAKLRTALEELGPTFIKIGQILATRPDIMPKPFIDEFKKLHDNVRPENPEDIKHIIETGLGSPPDALFLSFSPEPVACASMAEVHLARLKNNENVVVKVQRPKARETMESDINILRRLARFLKLTPPGSVMNPVEVVDELWNTLKDELNFLTEAQNIKSFYEKNKDIKCIRVPKVYSEYTTKNILVLEYIDGIKFTDKELIEAEGYILEDIASKLTNNYLKQIFTDGFFHADPHPGNILISGSKIVFIDFGMMGTLSKRIRNNFNSLLMGIVSRDVDSIMRAILKIGIKKGDIDYKKFHSDVEQMYNFYIDLSLDDINLPDMLDEMFKVCRKNSLSMPKDITMMLKGIMTLEGLITFIAPEISIMDIAVPFMRNKIISEKDFKQEIMEQSENLYKLSKHGLKLPVKLLELTNSISAGKLKINMEHINLEKSIGELHKMVNRLVFGIIVASLVIGSSLVVRADTGPKFFDISAFGLSGFIGASVLGLWLLVSIMRSGKL